MFLTQTVPRQREIIEVLFRNGWGYMRKLLTGGKPEDPQLPTPAVLKKIFIDLGPVYIKLGQLLSTRPDILSSAYIEELSTLQDEVPPVDWSEVEVLIRKQLKRPLEETCKYLNPVPVA
ncbi:ABC transporter, partial [Brunnivagina elsteri CCALA 953]